MSAVRDSIIATLTVADRPLRQYEIADRSGEVESSVRRECQTLERAGLIRRDTATGLPRFLLVPQPAAPETTASASL